MQHEFCLRKREEVMSAGHCSSTKVASGSHVPSLSSIHSQDTGWCPPKIC